MRWNSSKSARCTKYRLQPMRPFSTSTRQDATAGDGFGQGPASRPSDPSMRGRSVTNAMTNGGKVKTKGKVTRIVVRYRSRTRRCVQLRYTQIIIFLFQRRRGVALSTRTRVCQRLGTHGDFRRRSRSAPALCTRKGGVAKRWSRCRLRPIIFYHTGSQQPATPRMR